jgi:hypothetical protein
MYSLLHQHLGKIKRLIPIKSTPIPFQLDDYLGGLDEGVLSNLHRDAMYVPHREIKRYTIISVLI